MKISNKIIHKINETVEDASLSDYDIFNNQIASLIKDEEEAIASYKESIDILGKVMTDYQYIEITRTMTHIIDEEEEHIKELKKLKDDLDITSWK